MICLKKSVVSDLGARLPLILNCIKFFISYVDCYCYLYFLDLDMDEIVGFYEFYFAVLYIFEICS